jgi:hypothetical protein
MLLCVATLLHGKILYSHGTPISCFAGTTGKNSRLVQGTNDWRPIQGSLASPNRTKGVKPQITMACNSPCLPWTGATMLRRLQFSAEWKEMRCSDAVCGRRPCDVSKGLAPSWKHRKWVDGQILLATSAKIHVRSPGAQPNFRSWPMGMLEGGNADTPYLCLSKTHQQNTAKMLPKTSKDQFVLVNLDYSRRPLRKDFWIQQIARSLAQIQPPQSQVARWLSGLGKRTKEVWVSKMEAKVK